MAKKIRESGCNGDDTVVTLHGDNYEKIRQDSDPYCLLLLGLVIFSSYIFNYFYLAVTLPDTLIYITQYFLFLVGLPLLMIFFLIGYFRPEKGKAKNTAMSISVVVALFFVVFTYFFADALYTYSTITAQANIGFYYSVWGLGGAILTAAGFSIMHNLEESTSPGIMDTSLFHYGPTPEPAKESAEEELLAPQAAAKESSEISENAKESKAE